MSPEYRSWKNAIRQFMRTNYNDERLAMLLAHAQSGQLCYDSCCCFVGCATAEHALLGKAPHANVAHLVAARLLPFAEQAEKAYSYIGFAKRRSDWCQAYLTEKIFSEETEARRRAILIPMIRAEFKQRDRDRKPTLIEEVVAV